ncbi:hypothetical protein MUB18_17120 [Sphingobacterium sp. PCS056]|uniref:hypothetical protein n=1 Tax=Sphingobacterium sp. PCS056 TaxID=2931400 RepID=UPI00200FA703|nr:hypothetical protein [Sphingobacterium sp. PCS056]UPZ35826.1 hypothetical protein MUB18_17120 [Sphingobacterium sp. PCS056]
MSLILFYIIFAAILILFIAGTAYIGYWTLKKIGYKKAGTIIAVIVTTSLLMLTLSFVFEDELFTKSDAEKFLLQQNIKLEDDYKILNNKTSGWNDLVTTFELDISESDKTAIINTIKSADDYKLEITDEIDLPQLARERYRGDTLRANYESLDYFISSIYYPNGPGIKPTYRTIKIDKYKHILFFEEVLD